MIHNIITRKPVVLKREILEGTRLIVATVAYDVTFLRCLIHLLRYILVDMATYFPRTEYSGSLLLTTQNLIQAFNTNVPISNSTVVKAIVVIGNYLTTKEAWCDNALQNQWSVVDTVKEEQIEELVQSNQVYNRITFKTPNLLLQSYSSYQISIAKFALEILNESIRLEYSLDLLDQVPPPQPPIAA